MPTKTNDDLDMYILDYSGQWQKVSRVEELSLSETTEEYNRRKRIRKMMRDWFRGIDYEN